MTPYSRFYHIYSNINHEGKGVWTSAESIRNDQNICKVYRKLTPSQTSTLFNLFQAHSVTGSGLFLTPRDMDRLYDALPKSDQVSRKQRLLDWCFGANTTIQKLIGPPSPFPIQGDAVSKLPGELEAFIKGLTEPQAGRILQELRQLMDPGSNSGALRENDPGIAFLHVVKKTAASIFEEQNLMLLKFLLAAGPASSAIAQGLRAKENWYYNTALMHAVTAKRIDLVQALLYVANPDVKTLLLADCDRRGRTAFMIAVDRSDIAIMQALLDAAVDQRARDVLLTGRDFNTYTSLHIATGDANPQVVKFLLNAATTPDTKTSLLMGRTSYGQTALMLAVGKGNSEKTNILLDAASSLGPEVLARLVRGRNHRLQTAWVLAIYGGHIPVMQALWDATPLEDRAALFTDQDDEGKTPLMYACTPMVLKFFIDATESREVQMARLEDQDHMGRTILMHAAKNARLELVQELLRVGADFRARDSQGMTALMHSSETAFMNEHSQEIVEALIHAGADPLARDADGMTALMHASSQEVVEALIHAGADPLARDADGMTALMHAAKAISVNSENIILILLRTGLSLMDQDHAGRTALMHAAMHANLHKTHALLQVASLAQTTTLMMIKDNEGMTAFMHAVMATRFHIAKILFDVLDLEAKNTLLNATCTHIAAQGNLEALRNFIHFVEYTDDSDSDIEDALDLESKPSFISFLLGQDSEGRTLLMHAILEKDERMIKTLLRLGAKPTDCDNEGRSALIYAENLEDQDQDIVELLRSHHAQNQEQS